MMAAMLASSYFPEASDGGQTLGYRGVPSTSGYNALGGKQPPCPPGVEFCLRVTCAPPPEFMPSLMPIAVAIRWVWRLRGRKRACPVGFA